MKRLAAPLILIDWYGAQFAVYHMFESEVPCYFDGKGGVWTGKLARCRRWDSRDWYEF
jgi:hypothetical protein